MNKRLIAFLSILSLLLSTPLIPANAAAKAGAECTKAGSKEVVKGKNYICVKSGKKLVWQSSTSVGQGVTKPSTINSKSAKYWSSPSQYELLNYDKFPTRVFMGVEEEELRKQIQIWGVKSRIFLYVKNGGEEGWLVNSLEEVLSDPIINGRVHFPLWQKGFMDGSTFQIAIGPLFLNDAIELDTYIDGYQSALQSNLVPEKNWVLKTKIDISQITESIRVTSTPSTKPTPASTPVKTTNPTSRLPSCTGTQEANLVNLLAQAVASKRLVSTYRSYLEKTVNDLGDAYARNAMYDYEKLLIDKKSWEAKLDEQNKKLDNLTALEASILSACTRGGENSGSSTAPNQKKLPCTETEVSRLLIMISQYVSKQELIRIGRVKIEKLKVDLNYAVSSGRNTGSIQSDIQKYSRLLETDLGSANLIKREFEALNSGCLNSRLLLP